MSAVRFGNVLGSHGSVIPLFRSKSSAAALSQSPTGHCPLLYDDHRSCTAGAAGRRSGPGGSIYVLDMGEPVKIMDLANRLIRFYGYEPGVNMKVKVTVLRPGEKLYEELLMDSEQDKMAKTAHNKIFIAPPMQIDLAKFYADLQQLKDCRAQRRRRRTHPAGDGPTYHPNRRVHEDHTVVPPLATQRFSPRKRQKAPDEQEPSRA